MAFTMKSYSHALRLVAPAPVLAFALIEGALAAQPPVQGTAMLQPITITATRERTTVQTTPISITAVTAAQIASRGLVSLNSLVRSVPGLAIRDTGGPGEEEYEIRGLNSQGGNSSMVGVYFGEIPLSTAMGSQLGKNIMSVGLYDVRRVEVLRGPQGTLYGSSSMGGTIRVLPELPKLNIFSASTEEVLSGTTSGGGINHQENGMVNIPLGHTAAVRIVGIFTDDSGWIQRRVIQDGAVSVDTGSFPNVSRPSNFYTAPLQENLNGMNTTQIDSTRVELLWKPMKNLTIEPIAMYQLIKQGAPPAVDVNGSPTRPATPKILAHWEIYDAPEPQTDSLSFGSLKAVYRFPTFSATFASGFWHRNFIDLQDATEQVASAIGIPVYDAANGGIGPLMNIAGAGTYEQDYTRQISDEFRLASTVPGPLQWVAGYFYQDLYSANNISSIAPQATPIFGGPNIFVAEMPEILVQNAFYGHLSWRISRHLVVAAGFRRYHYSLSGSSSQVGAFTVSGAQGNDVPYNHAASFAASGTAPSFTMTYNIDPNHMVYLRIDKGFRLGGPDPAPIPVVAAGNTNPLFATEVANECALQAKLLATTACSSNIFLQVPTTFGSDWLWSYELGEKSSFLHHRLLADLDAYLEDWNNPQTATDIAGNFLMANGGDARIKGIEGQLETLLPEGFRLSLNASYIDAKFVQSSAITGFPSGTRIPDTPKVSGSAVLHWTHYLGNDHTLFSSIEEDYTGSRTDLPYGVTATLQNINQVLVHLPAYSIANFRFGVSGVRHGGNRWTAALFVDNFTNNIVLLDPQPQITLQTSAFTRYVVSQPLTAGIDVSYQFH
jgi:outer membrane receptor protein involved in Fe transport